MDERVEDRPLLLDGSARNLEALDDAEIWDALDRHGAILFRNFAVDTEAFYAFAARYNRSFLKSPFNDRKSYGQANELQTVTVGSAGLSLHFEYGASPMRPDLLWFYCAQPAAPGRGGETLLADGAAVFERLHPTTQAALLARRVTYRSFLPIPAFDSLLRHNRVIEQLAIDDYMRTLADDHQFRIVRETDLSVETLYTTAAARPRHGDARILLCQDIFGDAYKRATEQDGTESFSTAVTWEGGEPIEDAIIADIRATTRSLTRGIRWRAGDFAMIDNNRVLHGRNQTSDPARQIVMLSSFSHRFTLTRARATMPA